MAPAPPAGIASIWHPDGSGVQYGQFRREFRLEKAPQSPAVLFVAATQSPRDSDSPGTTPPKLVASYKLWINGVLAALGPGHSLPPSR